MEIILPVMLGTTPIWILLACIIWQLAMIKKDLEQDDDEIIIEEPKVEKKHSKFFEDIINEMKYDIREGVGKI